MSNSQQEPKQAETNQLYTQQIGLKNSDIRKNFQVVSSFLYTLTRSESKTDEEFEKKYNVYETLLGTNQRWGRNTQFVILGGLVTYCLKGNSIPIKLTSGFLYGYWIQHFYTLGSYVGVTMKLPWAINELDMGEKYETSLYLRKFLARLKQREDQYQKGEKILTDSQLIELLYQDRIGEKEAKKIFEKSYFANDYFEKNAHKYTKTSPDDINPNHIFSPHRSQDEMLRLKYFDSFLTRYIYHSFARFFKKSLFILGISQEQ
ncbi:hypothetical protein ABPG72_013616 [Tetrahymena utriculariae]